MVQLLIRDDDLNYFNRPDDIEKAYSRMPDLPISFACVPYIMDLSTKGNCPETKGNTIPRPFGDNHELVEYIKKGIEGGKYDVLLHGCTHEYKIDIIGNRYPEMVWRDSADLEEKIPAGKRYLEDLFETEIHWFASPSNTISKENLRVVYKNKLNYSGIIRLRFDRDLTFRSVWNYGKRLYYNYFSKIHYPGVFDYGTHLKFNASPLPSLDQKVVYRHFTHLFDFCQKHDCPLGINVHCWDMRDHPEKYDAFFSFIEYAIAHGAVPSRFRDIKG
ncbi:MAG: DUF2334 domain-containing protein [Acetivibrionales bacterium]|jgi:peptidoglycan/xylan/chitin deacetylase (PgdA/CDA1 family)